MTSLLSRGFKSDTSHENPHKQNEHTNNPRNLFIRLAVPILHKPRLLAHHPRPVLVISIPDLHPANRGVEGIRIVDAEVSYLAATAWVQEGALSEWYGWTGTRGVGGWAGLGLSIVIWMDLGKRGFVVLGKDRTV